MAPNSGCKSEAPDGTVRSMPTVNFPPKADFHLFLLVGQSNMAGRGDVAPENREPTPRVYAFDRNGEWRPAVDPIHFDKPVAGVGPGRSFAAVLAGRDSKISIGLIPAACGGSPISSWQPGAYFDQTDSHPYDDAIFRAKQAMKHGTLKGILWHQGESDCDEKLASVYQEKLEQLVERFRVDLGDPALPVIIGQLGQFEAVPWNDGTRQVDTAHKAVARKMSNVGFVRSDGLTVKTDLVHFDAPSQREFGKRYAVAYLSLAAAGADK